MFSSAVLFPKDHPLPSSIACTFLLLPVKQVIEMLLFVFCRFPPSPSVDVCKAFNTTPGGLIYCTGKTRYLECLVTLTCFQLENQMSPSQRKELLPKLCLYRCQVQSGPTVVMTYEH